MHWFSVLAILVLLALISRILRRRFSSSRAEVCKFVVAAQQALDRRDFASFDQNLERSKQTAEKLRDQAVRLAFRGDLALMSVQGAYFRGDIAGAENAARRAIEVLASMDPADRKGKLCSAHVFLGDIFLDQDQPARAAEEFRAAADLAEGSKVPVAVIFPLQRLADALLEEEKRDDAATVIDRCVQIEKDFLAKKPGPPSISMTAPDRSLIEADFTTAEKLFAEKVRFFENSGSNTPGIDVLRYRLHLAEAQQAQGKLEPARETLAAACAAAEKRFGPQHPRVAKIRRRLASIGQS